MTTQNCSRGGPASRSGRLFSSWLIGGILLLMLGVTGQAQSSSLGIKMVPVTLLLPQLQLTAPQGSTNVLEVSTNLTTWQDVTTLVFTSTNLLWVDIYPRGSAAYYRMRRINPGSLPPFPPPVTNLVWIPPGQFLMGSSSSDTNADVGVEMEQHSVTLTKGFFIGKYEVTRGEYLSVTGGNLTGDLSLPIDSVRWTEASNYCRLLNIQENLAGRLPAGYSYRLPTEAEWEYAARAGSTSRFSWGDDFGFLGLTNYAWYTANAGSPQPVGQKLPNAWGLYDVAGNVCEWCLDWFDNGGYPAGAVIDPQGPATGSEKVFRGGSFGDDDVYCRPAARRGFNPNPTIVVNIFGLRVVLAQTSP